MRNMNPRYWGRLTVGAAAMLFLVGCASARTTEDPGVYRGKERVGEILGTPVVRGQLYMIYKMITPTHFVRTRLGVPDDDIPRELMMPQYVYTLSREGENIGIAGIFPNRISPDGRTSTVMIPRRHVDRFLKSGASSATFSIIDP